MKVLCGNIDLQSIPTKSKLRTLRKKLAVDRFPGFVWTVYCLAWIEDPTGTESKSRGSRSMF